MMNSSFNSSPPVEDIKYEWQDKDIHLTPLQRPDNYRNTHFVFEYDGKAYTAEEIIREGGESANSDFSLKPMNSKETKKKKELKDRLIQCFDRVGNLTDKKIQHLVLRGNKLYAIDKNSNGRLLLDLDQCQRDERAVEATGRIQQRRGANDYEPFTPGAGNAKAAVKAAPKFLHNAIDAHRANDNKLAADNLRLFLQSVLNMAYGVCLALKGLKSILPHILTGLIFLSLVAPGAQIPALLITIITIAVLVGNIIGMTGSVLELGAQIGKCVEQEIFYRSAHMKLARFLIEHPLPSNGSVHGASVYLEDMKQLLNCIKDFSDNSLSKDKKDKFIADLEKHIQELESEINTGRKASSPAHMLYQQHYVEAAILLAEAFKNEYDTKPLELERRIGAVCAQDANDRFARIIKAANVNKTEGAKQIVETFKTIKDQARTIEVLHAKGIGIALLTIASFGLSFIPVSSLALSFASGDDVSMALGTLLFAANMKLGKKHTDHAKSIAYNTFEMPELGEDFVDLSVVPVGIPLRDKLNIIIEKRDARALFAFDADMRNLVETADLIKLLPHYIMRLPLFMTKQAIEVELQRLRDDDFFREAMATIEPNGNALEGEGEVVEAAAKAEEVEPVAQKPVMSLQQSAWAERIERANTYKKLSRLIDELILTGDERLVKLFEKQIAEAKLSGEERVKLNSAFFERREVLETLVDDIRAATNQRVALEAMIEPVLTTKSGPLFLLLEAQIKNSRMNGQLELLIKLEDRWLNHNWLSDNQNLPELAYPLEVRGRPTSIREMVLEDLETESLGVLESALQRAKRSNDEILEHHIKLKIYLLEKKKIEARKASKA